MEKNLVDLLAEAEANGKAKAEAEYKAQLEAVEAENKRKAELDEAVKKAKEEAKKEAEAEFKTNRQGGYTYNGHKNAKVGDDNEGMDAFIHYLRTGDEIPVKAALVEGTSGLGGVTVPNAFYNRIAEKYREQSVMRQLGPTVINTSYYKMDFPRIATGTSAAVYTAEAGSNDEQEPVFDSLTIQVYKMTQFMKISNELLSDTQANLEEVLANQLGSAFADQENSWFFNGNGTNQAFGAVTRASVGRTAASTGTITAAEFNDLVYSLADKYAARANLVMRRTTLGVLRGLTGNPFQFQTTPQGSGDQLLSIPVKQCSAIAAIATGAKTVLIGDFSNYVILENGGLVITRNPYLYMANGQTGIFATKRVGGDALLPEAFKYLAQA